ncbi:MAG TPA: iron-sulfur cluster assembly scaffold protein, partial [Epsilonproteobacteria bacterium]|nr:iron-sulfur cluster assembly scaffold protein [Campylobacterota bacterium]
MDEILIEHMMNPKNYGQMEDSNAQGIGKNPSNGEKVIVYLRIANGAIEDIAFQAIGCMTTIIAGSIITSEAKGLVLDRAYDLVATTLGLLDTVPPQEAACSEMVALALQAALDTNKQRELDSSFPMISYHISQNCVPQ